MLDEFRLKAYESLEFYKEKMKIWYELKILKREIAKGDPVMLYNSRMQLFPRKLKSKWSGPFMVTKVLANRVKKLKTIRGRDSK